LSRGKSGYANFIEYYLYNYTAVARQ